jgi:hypothetical protein
MVDPPRPLAARCPSVPAELEAVIFGCLEKSRERRTPDVAALATLLQPFASPAGRVSAERVVHLFASSPPLARGPAAAAPLRSEGPAAPTPSPAQEVTALESTTVDAGPPAGAARRGRGQLLLASAFVLLALAVGVGWARRRASGAPTATESASQAAQAALSGSADLAGRALVAARPGDSPEPVEVPPAVAVTAGTSRRAAGAAARGGKPALPASSARKKGQVDRNGVPILE